MLYAVIFALLVLAGAQQYLHDQERRRWEQERMALLDRIQAPDVAHAKAVKSLGDDDDPPLNERRRLERKAAELGVDPESFRTPPGWGRATL